MVAIAERKKAGQDIAARDRLLASATELFTRKGYAGTTVREIVQAAGVTKPVLYYYFRNKEGIYLELMREAFAQFETLLGASQEEPGSAKERLFRLYDRVMALFLENLPVARLMYSIYYGPPQGAPFFDFDAYHLRFQSTVGRLVEEGIRRGEFRRGNPEDMTWAVIGAINVTMELHLCHPEKGPGRDGLSRILNIIFSGISRQGREAGRVSAKPRGSREKRRSGGGT
ncbi:MAG TPA: TetR/AcrR family transcriptional regulator [Candidatus Deferrimicrobiaceae bacterium]|nr:TetR/AcrR family transcriptional regulator [Candidatus Deferrimicrobiaceae bacterium]